MPHLFDQIPENLFSILSSKNKLIYTDSLFVLREAFKTHLTIKREQLVVMLINRMEDAIINFKDEEDQDGKMVSGDLSSKANFLVRRLEQAGWIRIDFQGDSFEEVVALPEYSVILLNALYSLTQEQAREYNSFVVSTYNNLKNADAERNEYTFTTLERAYQDTLQLIDLLKSLYNNIGKYHQRLVEISKVNDILVSHFDEFKTKIIDKIYHPLKTLDSVPRFKGPILTILNKWMQDEKLIDQMISQAVKYNHCDSREEASAKIIENLNSIQEAYETLGEIIDQTDRKQTMYTRATIEKIQYLLSRDKTVKGKIVNILAQLNLTDEKIQDAIQNEIQIFDLQLIDNQSLYNRSKIKSTKIYNPQKITRMNDEDKQKLVKKFSQSLDSQFSNEGIRKFVSDLLDSGKTTSNEFLLETDTEYMKIILAAIKNGQSDMPYTIKFGNGRIRIKNKEIPEMKFIRKEKRKIDV